MRKGGNRKSLNRDGYIPVFVAWSTPAPFPRQTWFICEKLPVFLSFIFCGEFGGEIGGLAIDFVILVAVLPWAAFFCGKRGPGRPTGLALFGGQFFVNGGARSIVSLFCLECGPQFPFSFRGARSTARFLSLPTLYQKLVWFFYPSTFLVRRT